MWNHERKHLYFYLCSRQLEYECRVEESLTLRKILTRIRQDLQGSAKAVLPEDTAVFERETMICCDMEVPLSSLQVQNETTFLVF